jgi:hypothetical protein
MDLQGGDIVIWHYVNDYAYEVEDWFEDDEFPSLATDSTFYSKWLEAEVKDNVATVAVKADEVTAAVETAKKDGSTAVSVKVTGADSAKTAEVSLPKSSMTEMKGAKYNAATGKITFATTHFSKFLISEWINPFEDIAKGEWFYKAAR